MNSQSKSSHSLCCLYFANHPEEGLEMSFNSLDAQREACTQAHSSPASDRKAGGYSRLVTTTVAIQAAAWIEPALQQLLKDIEAGRVDTIVVYKVDRLTRSLADFAKIVEALDARGVSFVSVTQQFNTTTSMGRLTLNVLLSFAQFEREVTGERIRDKIAASKRKGMWMGGTIPLGYDLKDRKLIVNQQEAEFVLRLFNVYLELECVSKLKSRLDREGSKSKLRTSVSGKRSGGTSYSRGALYKILKNRIYVGEIHHRGQSYPGEHEAIVPRELWDRVQAQLQSDHQGRRYGLKTNCSSLLAGLLRDTSGNRFTPSHTVKKGKRYRYYVCHTSNNLSATPSKPVRLPAHDVERQVSLRLRSFLQSRDEIICELGHPEDSSELTYLLVTVALKHAAGWLTASPVGLKDFIRRVTRRVVVHPDKIRVEVSKRDIRTALIGDHRSPSPQPLIDHEKKPGDLVHLEVEARVKRFSEGEMLARFSSPAESATIPSCFPPPY